MKHVLSIKRPLIIFDLETTGVNPDSDRIIDLAALKINPDRDDEALARRYNPGIPISPEATAVHGISDADVAEFPTLNSSTAEELVKFFRGADVCGFNVKFDLGFLKKSLERASFSLFVEDWRPLILDAFKIYTMYEKRTLTAAVRFYLQEDHTEAHSASADVLATKRVFEAQLQRYPDLPRNAEDLHLLLNKPPVGYLDPDRKLKWVGSEPCIAFGKHNGKSLRSVDKAYLQWMLGGEFSDVVKDIISNALKGKYPTNEEL